MGTGARPRAAAVVVLRDARVEDVASLHDIELASFSDPWSRHAIAAAITASSLSVVVAESSPPDPRLLGYSVVARAADEAELLNLAVRVDARGKGVGTALVNRAVAEARAWGSRAVFLEVRESNAAARALYAAAGFEQVGRRRGYYRRPVEDALILRRLLE